MDPWKGHTEPMAATAAASTPAPTSVARWHQIGADALYLLTGGLAACVAFTVWVTGIALSLSLGLLIIGIPVVLLTFAAFRLLADLERKRAGLVFGEPLMSDYRPLPKGHRIGPRLRVATMDPQTLEGHRLPGDLQLRRLHLGRALELSSGASRSAASSSPPGGGRCRATRSTSA